MPEVKLPKKEPINLSESINIPKVWAEHAIKLAEEIEDYNFEFGRLSSDARADIRNFVIYIKSLKALLK